MWTRRGFLGLVQAGAIAIVLGIGACTKPPEQPAAAAPATIADAGSRFDCATPRGQVLAPSDLRAPLKPLFATPADCDLYLGFARQSNLDPAGYNLQERSIATYLVARDRLVRAYIDRNGFVADTDAARSLFESLGYNGWNAAAVQEASSALAKDVWRRGLEIRAPPEAAIYAGGAGSGKTSVIEPLFSDRLKNRTAVTMDGTLASFRSAQKRIGEALAAGKTPIVYYIYREPMDAWVNGVIKRAIVNESAGGRVVPLTQFLRTHRGALATVQRLASMPGVKVVAIDNSRGLGKQQEMEVSQLQALSFEPDEAAFIEALERAYNEGLGYGRLTERQRDEMLK